VPGAAGADYSTPRSLAGSTGQKGGREGMGVTVARQVPPCSRVEPASVIVEKHKSTKTTLAAFCDS